MTWGRGPVKFFHKDTVLSLLYVSNFPVACHLYNKLSVHVCMDFLVLVLYFVPLVYLCLLKLVPYCANSLTKSFIFCFYSLVRQALPLVSRVSWLVLALRFPMYILESSLDLHKIAVEILLWNSLESTGYFRGVLIFLQYRVFQSLNMMFLFICLGLL